MGHNKRKFGMADELWKVNGDCMKMNMVRSPPYAIPYGCGIPNPIYGYGYGVGIMRLMPLVVDMRLEIGESGSEKKLVTLLRPKS